MYVRSQVFNPDYFAEEINNLSWNLPKGDVSILEPGCGIGAKSELIRNIIEKNGAIIEKHDAIDLSKSSIEYARQNGNSDVTYSEGDFLSYSSLKYDYIFLAAVWQHFEDTREAMQKIEDLLNPGGIAIILNNFYGESAVSKIVTHVLSDVYQNLFKREEVYYNKVSISEIQELVSLYSNNLLYLGDFEANFPAIFARVVVLQKRIDL